MKVDKIILNNFKQYYGKVEIDLKTKDDKNIILIGGKNGYGKTNFLLSIVWCLYGQKISQIDDGFKKEIQKQSNYQKFMKQSLNYIAVKENILDFFVEIHISEIDLSGIQNPNLSNKIIIRRTFNTFNSEETIAIIHPENNQEVFKEEEECINFINDYLIPLEASKFIFFDAEKVASWAELSAKEEGNVLNDALGKLLGLDIYEGLKEDIKQYTNNLRKEGANINIKEQIENTESAIRLNKTKIENIEIEIAENEQKIEDLKEKINKYQFFLNQNSKNIDTFNREELVKQKEILEQKEEELRIKFNELSELIPLAMLAGKIEEVLEQIDKQNKHNLSKEENKEIRSKLDIFIEKLFNHPPEPKEGPISFKNKTFYSQKANNLLDEIFIPKENKIDLGFELDITKFDTELIYKASDTLKYQSKELFENNIEEFNKIQISIKEIEKKINLIDADLEDEIVLETLTKKEEAERKKEKLLSKNGALNNDKEKYNKEIARLNQHYKSLIAKSEVTATNKLKLETANRYIKTINQFIISQKKQKKSSLENNILIEMKKLMHKLDENSKFIAETRVEILPDDTGLKVSLFNEDGYEIPKSTLSQGEKQVYISCLIKAILQEAIQTFPIFIDTPLGRLDNEHIKKILLYYYPDLSEQVIILATNNEITPKRYEEIKDHISQTYLLTNIDTKSFFKSGYYKSYEN